MREAAPQPEFQALSTALIAQVKPGPVGSKLNFNLFHILALTEENIYPNAVAQFAGLAAATSSDLCFEVSLWSAVQFTLPKTKTIAFVHQWPKVHMAQPPSSHNPDSDQ